MIEIARTEDTDQIMAVYRECFPGEEEFCRFFFEHVYKPENTLVYRLDCVAASVQLLPAALRLDGAAVPATYIYAAGTLAKFRSRGLMRQLLERSFEISAARGDELSVLIVQQPSLISYYEKLGYRAVFSRERCRVSACALPVRARRMRAADFSALNALYEQAQKGLHAVRTEEDWRLIMLQYGAQAQVLEDESGAVQGYALVEEVRDGILYATEALGAQCRGLMAAQAARAGAVQAEWFEPVCKAAESNGCARALTKSGERLLRSMPGCGYLNVMFN